MLFPYSVTSDHSRNHQLIYFALPAQFHFVHPAALIFALAKGPSKKPTEISDFELPHKTILSPLDGAVRYLPTRRRVLIHSSTHGQKE